MKSPFSSAKLTANPYIAAKGMQELLTSGIYVNSSATADFDAAVKSAVVVSGTWNYENAKSILGDNLGIAELPSYTVDGSDMLLEDMRYFKIKQHATGKCFDNTCALYLNIANLEELYVTVKQVEVPTV